MLLLNKINKLLLHTSLRVKKRNVLLSCRQGFLFEIRTSLFLLQDPSENDGDLSSKTW